MDKKPPIEIKQGDNEVVITKFVKHGEKETKYGKQTWFMYGTADEQGEEAGPLFAKYSIHKQLEPLLAQGFKKFIINKSGEGKETRYQVTPKNDGSVKQKVDNSEVDWDAKDRMNIWQTSMQTAGRIYTGTKIDQKTFQDYVRPLYMAGLAVRFGLKIADKGKESDPQEEFIKGLEDDQHVIEPDNTEPKSDEIPL